MFRKLVSSLPFSPGLVGQLGVHTKKVKREQRIRRFGLIFVALMLLIQFFITISPPEQALANKKSDIVPGGFASLDDALRLHDSDTIAANDFKGLLLYLGISRAELAQTVAGQICATDQAIVTFTRQHLFSASEGERIHQLPNQVGGQTTVYSAPLHLRVSGEDNFCTEAFIGNSEKSGWFAVAKNSGDVSIKQDQKTLPRMEFIAASCKTIQGYVDNVENHDQPPRIYLFFGGPPGKGQAYGPITADQQPSQGIKGSGFNLAVPQQYLKNPEPTMVWGAIEPYDGWESGGIHAVNTTVIPAHCQQPPQSIAQCTSIVVKNIEQTRYQLTANSLVDNGVELSGYRFQVLAASGETIFDKTYQTTGKQAVSETFAAQKQGEYTAKVTAITSIGERTGNGCTQRFTVSSSPDQCNSQLNMNSSRSSECQPCEYNTSLRKNDTECTPKFVQSIESKNLTRSDEIVQPGDRIEYIIHTTNLSDELLTTNISIDLSDALEYGTLFEFGGGNLNNETDVLRWDKVTLGIKGTDSRRIVLQIADPVPSTPQAGNNPVSFDCALFTAFGNSSKLHLTCPFAKTIEFAAHSLPLLSNITTVVFCATILLLALFFYLRTLLLRKELRLIREEFNGGTIN